jgi:hypothetical protein
LAIITRQALIVDLKRNLELRLPITEKKHGYSIKIDWVKEEMLFVIVDRRKSPAGAMFFH